MPALSGFHHVKLPVGDVVRSRDWYQAVLGLDVDIEFVEDGVLMGVALRDPTGTVTLAARHDPQRAAALAGFDLIAVGVPTRTDLEAWVSRLDALGQPHGGIVTGHQVGSWSDCTTRTASRSGSTPWNGMTRGRRHELRRIGLRSGRGRRGHPVVPRHPHDREGGRRPHRRCAHRHRVVGAGGVRSSPARAPHRGRDVLRVGGGDGPRVRRSAVDGGPRGLRLPAAWRRARIRRQPRPGARPAAHHPRRFRGLRGGGRPASGGPRTA